MAIIKMILLIGLLIFVHELGHFLVAKMFGMKVEKFCFGLPFGPILYEKKIGDVTYGIHWLFFLGGYVAFPDDDKDNGLPEDSPDLFKNRPIYQRACVLLAGVTANLITAYLLVIFCCLHWHYLPGGQYNIYVDKFQNQQSRAFKGGLKEGDKIAIINGKSVEYPNELIIVTDLSKKFNDKISQNQYNKVLEQFLALNPSYKEDSIIKSGETVKLPKTVTEDKVVLTNTEIFGLKSKEKPLELNENQQKIRNDAYEKESYKAKEDIAVKDFVAGISDTYSPIDLTVERAGELIDIKNLSSGEEGKLGILLGVEEKNTKINSLGSAIVESHKYMWRNTKLMIWSLKLLVTGQVPLDKMTSVVAITKIGSNIIEKSGMLKGLLLTAIISLNLAILNIMPVPALDGGHLMFLIIEKIKGSPVNEKVIETCSNIFFYILIALMIFLVGNDIWSIWVKKLY